jgi:hypothetical protein
MQLPIEYALASLFNIWKSGCKFCPPLFRILKKGRNSKRDYCPISKYLKTTYCTNPVIASLPPFPEYPVPKSLTQAKLPLLLYSLELQ